MKKNKFIYHLRKNTRLSIPIITGQLGHMVTALVDNVMIGQNGELPLAAASLANSIFTAVMVFGIGLAIGITPSVASADARKDYTTLSSSLSNGFSLHAGVAIFLVALLLSISPLIHYLNQPEDVVVKSLPYFKILVFSLFPLLVFLSAKQFLEGLSLTVYAMVISIAGNVLNVILNYLLIFGKAGFPEMGLNGAGTATLISRFAMATALCIYLFSPQLKRAYHFSFKPKLLKLKEQWILLKLGAPIGFQMIFEVGAFVIATIFMGWISTEALAAHQIALSLASITYMFANGMAAAATIRVGNQLGLKDFNMMTKAANTIFLMVASLMLGFGLIFIVFRSFLPELFIDNPGVIAIAAEILIIAGLFQLSDGLQACALGALRGLQDTAIPSAVSFFAYLICGIPLAYLLAFHFDLGAIGVWSGLLIGLSISAIMLMIRFYWLKARLQKA